VGTVVGRGAAVVTGLGFTVVVVVDDDDDVVEVAGVEVDVVLEVAGAARAGWFLVGA